MKAILIQEHGEPEVLQLTDHPKPTPAANEVLLRMLTTSVNFADVKMRRSLYRNKKPPFIPGFDGVGIIEAVGGEVKTLKPGQRVAAYVLKGSYAEFALSTEALCYPLSSAISDEDAAGIGVFITASNALRYAARFQKGESILIHAGAGGVGSSAVQMAKILGASQIIATVGSPGKVEAAKSCGADVVIDYNREDFAKRVLEETEQKGVNVILETIGGEVFEKSLTCLAPFGRLVTFGHSSSTPGTAKSNQLHRQNQAIIGYSSGGFRKTTPEFLQDAASWVLQQLEKKQLQLLTRKTFPLEQASQAHALLENRQAIGKVLLKAQES